MKTNLLITALAGITLAGSAGAAPIVLTTSADATYFAVSGSDIRVNNDLVRVGRNNSNSVNFLGLIGFDLNATGLTVLELQNSTYELEFLLGGADNNPGLDQLQIDYIGTFADQSFGVNGINGANANATVLATAVSLEEVFSGVITDNAPGASNGAAGGFGTQTFAADISSDTFANRYAFFRLSDPNGGLHQWDIVDLTNATESSPAATLTIEVPEPGSLALIGLGGLMMIKRRRRA